MTQAILYITPAGDFKRAGSYSARRDFKFCKRYFKLTRKDGWKPKAFAAATVFGNAVEKAVQFHVEHRGSGGPAKFVELWNEFRNDKEFEKYEYTALEESWETMLRMGTEHLLIFELRYPHLPLQRARFQVPTLKEIFPKTNYAGLSNRAYIDILSRPPWDHPLLPKIDKPTSQVWKDLNVQPVRTLIIDCKTSAKDLDEKLVGLDPQLVEYAWQLKNLDVAFLWFGKKNLGYERGSRVTLLRDTIAHAAGADLVVVQYGKDDKGIWIGTSAVLDDYEKATRDDVGAKFTGNALKAAKVRFLDLGLAIQVDPSMLTKQRMQFGAARLDSQDVSDAGKRIGQLTVEMVVAQEQDFYPKEGGIRFPDNKCPTCRMRYICSNDNEARDKFLTRTGEEWLEVEIDEE